MVSDEIRALVCHFGLSKLVEEATENSAQVTLTTEPSYSRYLAPELVRGEVTSPRMNTDVYSFGMAMLECLTLEKPFANRKRVILLGYIAER
jgi:serine/threonine protein kinase